MLKVRKKSVYHWQIRKPSGPKPKKKSRYTLAETKITTTYHKN